MYHSIPTDHVIKLQPTFDFWQFISEQYFENVGILTFLQSFESYLILPSPPTHAGASCNFLRDNTQSVTLSFVQCYFNLMQFFGDIFNQLLYKIQGYIESCLFDCLYLSDHPAVSQSVLMFLLIGLLFFSVVFYNINIP